MNPPRHIVAVTGLVTNAEGHVLMIRSPRRGWECPGGQVEEGETLVQALLREILEETGVEVVVGKLVGVYSNLKSNIVAFAFLCEWLSSDLCTSPESLEVEWVVREEALSRISHPALRERMRRYAEVGGEVVYRAYSYEATKAHTEYTVHEERRV